MKIGWKSEVARALCAKVEESDPEVAIQSLICQKLAGIGNGTIPVDLDEVRDELGIDEIREEECPGAGYLYDDGNECWIGVNIHDSEQRRRFTIAHEMIHFMLPTHRVGKHSDASVGSYDRDSSEEEYLCDLGASFLLMPGEKFTRMTKDKPISCHLLRIISRTFNVSLEAAIVTSCNRIQSEFLVAKWSPNQDGSMSLADAYRSSQIAYDYWLDEGTTVSPTHPIARISEARHPKPIFSRFCLKHSQQSIYMAADYMSLGRSGSDVISVLRPLPHQEWKPL